MEHVKIRVELQNAQGAIMWQNWVEGPNTSRTFNRLAAMFQAASVNETFRMEEGDTITFTCVKGER